MTVKNSPAVEVTQSDVESITFTDEQLLSMPPAAIPTDQLLRTHQLFKDQWNATENPNARQKATKGGRKVEMELDALEIEYPNHFPEGPQSRVVDYATLSTEDLLSAHAEDVKLRASATSGVKSHATRRLVAIEAVLTERDVRFVPAARQNANYGAIFADEAKLKLRIRTMRGLIAKYQRDGATKTKIKLAESQLRAAESMADERGIDVPAGVAPNPTD